MGLEMCLSLFGFAPFSYVHYQLGMVFKVIRECSSFNHWKEIKTDWDLRRKMSVVRVYKGRSCKPLICSFKDWVMHCQCLSFL